MQGGCSATPSLRSPAAELRRVGVRLPAVSPWSRRACARLLYADALSGRMRIASVKRSKAARTSPDSAAHTPCNSSSLTCARTSASKPLSAKRERGRKKEKLGRGVEGINHSCLTPTCINQESARLDMFANTVTLLSIQNKIRALQC